MAAWLYPLTTIALGLFLLIVEVHDHGRTNDDKVRRERGQAVLQYLSNFDRAELPLDLEIRDKGDKLFGPLGGVLALSAGSLLAPLFGDVAQEKQLVFHTGLTLWFLLMFLSLCFLGRRCLGSTEAGLLCGLVLLAQPRIFGLATVNPSDLPAAATTCLAVLLLLRWLEQANWTRTIIACIPIGATAAIRPQNGVQLLPLLGCFLAAAFIAEARAARKGGRARRPFPRKFLFAAPFISYAFWILFWPDFWTEPLKGPLSVLQGFFDTGERYMQSTLWFGELLEGPVLYAFVYTLVTTPLWVLLPALLGLATQQKLSRPIWIALSCWFLISAGKHLTGLANHGGIRHFLDAFLPLSIFAAAGLAWLWQRLLGERSLIWLLVLFSPFLVLARSLHPFEGSYYNVLVGGPSGAAGLFDLEPNGSSMLPLLKRLRPLLEKDDVILVIGNKDLVVQVPLSHDPQYEAVHELIPQMLPALENSELRQRFFAGKRVIVLAIQSRSFGFLDQLIEDGVLEMKLSVGPAGLPLCMALEVKKESFYQRLSEALGEN